MGTRKGVVLMAIARDDPRRCTAKSKQTGNRCGLASVPGLNVCKFHGGGTQASKDKARRIIGEAAKTAAQVMVDMMFDKTAPHNVRISAAKDLMDRAGLKPEEKVSLTLSKFEQAVESGEILVDIGGEQEQEQGNEAE